MKIFSRRVDDGRGKRSEKKDVVESNLKDERRRDVRERRIVCSPIPRSIIDRRKTREGTAVAPEAPGSSNLSLHFGVPVPLSQLQPSFITSDERPLDRYKNHSYDPTSTPGPWLPRDFNKISEIPILFRENRDWTDEFGMLNWESRRGNENKFVFDFSRPTLCRNR